MSLVLLAGAVVDSFEPSSLANGNSGKRETMKSEGTKESRSDQEEGGDEDHSNGQASPLKEANELNGTYENMDTKRTEQNLSSRSPARSSTMENGLSETEPPHGSRVGSNGYILNKQQEDTVSTPHRTNWSPVGGSTLGHGTKSSPTSASTFRPPDQGSSNSAASPGPSPIERRADTETKNGRVSNTPPPTIHRARKTMSRPASNQTLKLLNRENKEPVVVKDDSLGKPETVQPQPSPIQNQLPQSQTDATSVLNTTPAKPQTVEPRPVSPSVAAVSRKKKRKMGTYSLVPKKKNKVLKQRTVLEMFQRMSQSQPNPQMSKESVHVNGERIENESDEEESEEGEDTEEDEELVREDGAKASQEGPKIASVSQPLEEEQESEESPEGEGEEEGDESDLSSESSLKKKWKKKVKGDHAWLRPSRKRKRKLKAKTEGLSGMESQSQSESQCSPSAPSENRKEYKEVPLDSLNLVAQEALLTSQNTAVSGSVESTDADMVQELPLCSCRMEMPKSREILTLADRKCMATESIDGQLSRCQSAVLKHEMMRPSNSVQLLVLCEDHRTGMVKHQCCPGCGFFCRAGVFMECQPEVNISHRFHRACASVLNGQSFCPHCGEEVSKAKEVTIAKADTTSTVPLTHGPCTPSTSEGKADTTTGGSTRLSILGEGKADSTLPRPTQDTSVSPLGSKTGPVGAGFGTGLPPKETLESVLLALDAEKPKKLRFHPKQLYISAKQGELQKVLLMLVDGIDPNFKMESQNKRTPLHVAAEAGHQEVCHMLVQAGANLDMCDEDQRTPLMEACENDHLDTVRYLLRAGAIVSHKDVEGSSCLHLAAKAGHFGIVQHLLSTGIVDINCQDDGGWTAMIWATEYKHIDQVKLLLCKGADINIRDKEENICLHWAAFSGCVEIAEILLDAKCDLNAVNIHGDSPLHIASRESRLDCVKRKKLRFHPRQLYPAAKQGEAQRVLLMLMEGIDPSYQSDSQNRRCALHAAAQRGLLEVCYLLIQAGAKVDAQDKTLRTPLLEAIVNNHVEVVKYLIQSGACVYHAEEDGSTGLHHAAKLGNLEVVMLLLSTGQVDLNAQEMNVCLHWASFAGSAEIAELVLNAGCPLSTVNLHGDTPLHIAAREGFIDCVTLFLSRGADIDIMNKEGDTPLSLARCDTPVWVALQINRKLRRGIANRVVRTERIICSDVAQGYENVPIPCVNGVDDEGCPSDYKYIAENCETSTMNIDRNITHLQHCSCTDDCSSSNCLCGQLSIRCWYDKVKYCSVSTMSSETPDSINEIH
ncbi:histone-lysine N-methyltransferase EHMT1-like [Puntigrus tetrazona]|uniref:histone-lysine N-methyltransferase EHMT1-like n=1 Tax=Puntigrus tetrazona TaxID=1606681 RepID=UPI001C8A2787|nr:histone-lysine N-methyltransferase EHMT1-like [Puntigrus tetrazona]